MRSPLTLYVKTVERWIRQRTQKWANTSACHPSTVDVVEKFCRTSDFGVFNDWSTMKGHRKNGPNSARRSRPAGLTGGTPVNSQIARKGGENVCDSEILAGLACFALFISIGSVTIKDWKRESRQAHLTVVLMAVVGVVVTIIWLGDWKVAAVFAAIATLRLTDFI